MEILLYIYTVINEITTMKTMNQKSLDYLKGNPKVAEFLTKVNEERKEYYKNIMSSKSNTDLVMEVGNKFLRFWDGTACWGFISRVDGDLKGAPIKKGDLLKCASWKAPAKHARGNILDGTARYGVYGPEYL
jgi:hypothetical protein